MVGGIGSALAAFAWAEEEEEGDPGEVTDCDISWGGYLGSDVQYLNDVDGEGPHYCWGITPLLIGRQLASQTKFESPHGVVAGVVGPHRCEYFTDLVEVLVDQSLLDGFPLRG